ncbi:histidine kinase [Paenibacillus darwinianus]|uniref:Histidine kinase n=1 Tax=Paenibacillus darwinianus TaxID=1380763 RepID=A0A9W5RYS7_9BACL|nr:methyl-accepting chemotaxis protein [Paenibacillus darwinianus]EXX84697.1 histidine kinase [Paenibacillus darwinianus]EXX84698.1 histidine kinase [Paenibacillus darwinianus]EXX84737.1 histidine kinase [Paenibacillus darwinianus]
MKTAAKLGSILSYPMRTFGMLRNLKFRSKLLILNVTAIVSIFAIGFVGYYYTAGMAANSTGLYEESLLPVKWLKQIQTNMRTIDSASLETVVSGSTNRVKLLNMEIEKQTKQTDELIDQLKQINTDENEKLLLDSFLELYPQYVKSLNLMLELSAAGQKTEAYSAYSKEVFRLKDRVNNLINELAMYREVRAEQLNDDNGKDYAAAFRIIVIAAAAAVVLMVAIGVAINRAITHPIRALQLQMQQAAAGDLSARGNYPYRDEVGSLSQSFNAMVDGLQSLVQQINGNAQTLSVQSAALLASAQEGSNAANHMASSSQLLADEFEKQVDAVSQANDSVQLMNTNIVHIENAAGSVALLSKDASAASRDGLDSVEAIAGQMNAISAAVRNATDRILELNQRAGEIGNIVGVMNDIAKQTNLLALNASIEAARAGEVGRGFAVVANEVKKLADQSSRSSRNIEELIRQTQSGIAGAAASMETGTRQVEQGLAATAAVQESFHRIETAVNNVYVKADDVNAAVLQLAESNDKIVEVMRIVSTMSETGLSISQEVSAASEQQFAGNHEISHSAEALSDMSVELQASLRRFKI